MTRRSLFGPHEARRLALAAQGFGSPRPTGRVDRRHVRGVLQRVGCIQIDSVNVVVRSQELPLWARLGDHPRTLLPAMAHDVELVEYWCHEASLVPVTWWPLLQWRMQAARDGRGTWSGLAQLQRDHPGYVEAVLAEVRERGPLTAGGLSDPGTRSGPWWGWNRGKQALEYLFWCGHLTARRGPTFERVYDLPERVLPAHVLAAAVPTEHDARKELLVLAARACGVGTAADLADYPRIRLTAARPLLDELVAEGRLEAVQVAGWDAPAYLHPDATLPRAVHARALLSPFDSLVWCRPRDERLFGFHYRLELYTPAPKRRYGYYVLPFLLGDALVARVDVKADRSAGVLRVPGAFAEPGTDPHDVTANLAEELTAMAAWLGLERVAVGTADGTAGRGDLSALLARRLAPRRSGGAAPSAADRRRPSPSAAGRARPASPPAP